jgi:hypothetical protein
MEEIVQFMVQPLQKHSTACAGLTVTADGLECL